MMTIYKQLKKNIANMNLIIGNISIISRADFEKESPILNGKINIVTLELLTKNVALFGMSGDVYSEVFPRMVNIKNQLLKGIVLPIGWKIEFTYKYFEPFVLRDTIGKVEINSFGSEIIDIQRLAAQNSYYKELLKNFEVYYGVKTNNGTVIGPDAGLIIANNCLAECIGKNTDIKMIEVGAGTCSTPISMIDKCVLKSYIGFDFSENMVCFFNKKIKPIFDKKEIYSTVYLKAANEIELKNYSANIFVLGIYYEAQFDFIIKKGKDIKDILGDKGVLVIQSGLPENRFFNNLLFTETSDWPWFNNNGCLLNYFNYVLQVNVLDEIVILATNNKNLFEQVLLKLASRFNIEKIKINSTSDYR